jgi:hypothetical protein
MRLPKARGSAGDGRHAVRFPARSRSREALENGAQLEDVQKAAGHRDHGTTKLYNRRFDFVVSPEPPTLAAHHTIFWEIRA